MLDESNVGWVHQSIGIYQKFFPNVNFNWTTYFNSGFLIYNKKHQDLVETIKKFWTDNDKELYEIQKTKRKGNDQTPVNYIVRDMGLSEIWCNIIEGDCLDQLDEVQFTGYDEPKLTHEEFHVLCDMEMMEFKSE